MFTAQRRTMLPANQHQDPKNNKKKNMFFDQDESDEEISRASSTKRGGGGGGGRSRGLVSPLQHSDRSRSGSSSSRHQDQARSRGSSTHSNKSEKDDLGSLDLGRTMRRPLHLEFNKSNQQTQSKTKNKSIIDFKN